MRILTVFEIIEDVIDELVNAHYYWKDQEVHLSKVPMSETIMIIKIFKRKFRITNVDLKNIEYEVIKYCNNNSDEIKSFDYYQPSHINIQWRIVQGILNNLRSNQINFDDED